MPTIRILLIQPGAAARRLTAGVLSCDPDLEVAGTAADGQLGTAKAAQVRPDLVLVDAALPGDDDAVAALRHAHPLLPIVLFAGPPPRSGRCSRELLRGRRKSVGHDAAAGR